MAARGWVRLAAWGMATGIHLLVLVAWRSEPEPVAPDTGGAQKVRMRLSFRQSQSTPLPEPKPAPKPAPKPEPKPEPRPRKAAASSASQAPRQAPVEDPGPDLEAVKERYFAELLSRIERHKRFPRAAQRRRMEGSVQVAFRIGHHGEVQALRATGRFSVLCHAAKQAVRQASPLPSPPSALRPPVKVHYRMAFRLR